MNSSQSLQSFSNMARFLASLKEWCSTRIKKVRQIISSESPIYYVQHFLTMNLWFRPSTIPFPIYLRLLMERNSFFVVFFFFTVVVRGFFLLHIYQLEKHQEVKSLPHFIRYLYSDKHNGILIFVGLTPITVVQTRMTALPHSRHTATKPFILWELLDEWVWATPYSHKKLNKTWKEILHESGQKL